MHFLLYDTVREPVRCILQIPYEQFTKFYRFKPHSRRSQVFYHIRYLYFLYYLLFIACQKLIRGTKTFLRMQTC